MEIFIKFVQHVIHTNPAAQTRLHEALRRTPQSCSQDEWIFPARPFGCYRQPP